MIAIAVVGAVILAIGGYQWLQEGERAPAPARSEGDELRTSLVDKAHTGALELAGWESWGGALMRNGLSWAEYRRSDGAALVLIEAVSRETPEAAQATFRTLDVLFVPRLADGEQLSFACKGSGAGPPGKIFSVVQPDHGRQWWPAGAQTWQVDAAGRIAPISREGVECANEGWGGD